MIAPLQKHLQQENGVDDKLVHGYKGRVDDSRFPKRRQGAAPRWLCPAEIRDASHDPAKSRWPHVQSHAQEGSSAHRLPNPKHPRHRNTAAHIQPATAHGCAAQVRDLTTQTGVRPHSPHCSSAAPPSRGCHVLQLPSKHTTQPAPFPTSTAAQGTTQFRRIYAQFTEAAEYCREFQVWPRRLHLGMMNSEGAKFPIGGVSANPKAPRRRPGGAQAGCLRLNY